MAQQQSVRGTARRAAVRYGVPVAVASVAAATIGFAPAFAGSGDPDLPEVSAQELVGRIAAADAEQLSGMVRIDTDLGLPELPGMTSGGRGGHGGPFGSDREYRDGEREGERPGPSADPRDRLMELASGSHLLRVAVAGPERQRLSVIEEAAEYSLIRNGDELWAYDSAANQVYHRTLPEHRAHGEEQREKRHRALEGLTPQQAAERALEAVDDTTAVSVDGTAKVAGRDAYQLLIEPKGGHSTIGSVRIAVDAEQGVPLKFTLQPSGGGKAVVDVGFTEVDFGKPAAGTFEFKPPKGAEVTEGGQREANRHHRGDLAGPSGLAGLSGPSGLRTLGEGWNSVAVLELPGPVLQPGGGGVTGGRDGAEGRSAERLLDSFTDEVSGDFGNGRVFSTRLINALITDDGTVYIGAVTEEGLIEKAEQHQNGS